MTKKILAVCVLCCFASSTLYAQAMPFAEHATAVQAASNNIKEKLDQLIEQLERGDSIKTVDLENIVSQIRDIEYEVNAMPACLAGPLSADNATGCQTIRLISLAWAAIGALSATSLLTGIVRLAIKQANPGVFPQRQQRKILQQYVKTARKLLVAAVIIPVSAINIFLASRQYRECLSTDL